MQDESPEFGQLRRLLALKRHEVPPPGYFRDFSTRVIDRLEREDSNPSQRDWWGRLGALLRVRPAISASFCLATALVLLAATTLFENQPHGAASPIPVLEPALAVSQPSPSAAASGMVFVTNLESRGFAVEIAPSRPVRMPTNSLFDAPFYQRVEPVSYGQ